jgi:hypothetical protein
LEWKTIVTLKFYRLKSFGLIFSQLIIVLTFCAWVSAAQSREDYDIDDDGLVEIQSIDDIHRMLTKTNQLRNQPYPGCPNQKCIGFELTQGLTFSTNAVPVKELKKTVGYQGVNAKKPKEASPYVDANWPIIRRFELIFEGNGHYLSNISLNEHSRAMFDTATHAVFRNITISINPQSRSRSAVLASGATDTEFNHITINGGYALNGLLAMRVHNSKISHCVIKGEVKGTHGVGLLMGKAKKTIVSNCTIQGKVTGSHDVGLIAGHSDSSEFHDLTVKGDIEGAFNTAGGIGEVVNSLFRQVTVQASVTGRHLSVGGLAGKLEGSDIRNSLFSGDIYASSSDVGGIAGMIVRSHLQENEVDAKIVAQKNVGLIAGSAKGSSVQKFKFSGLATLKRRSNDDTEIKPITDWFASQSETTMSHVEYNPTLPQKTKTQPWYSSIFEELVTKIR